MTRLKKVAIVAAGAWGTALAIPLSEDAEDVVLWSRRAGWADEFNASRQNRSSLPGVTLPPNVRAVQDLEEVLIRAHLVILAPESAGLRDVCRRIAQICPSVPLVSATKGLEPGSLLRMSQVIREELPERVHSHIAVLSGPNFSAEVAQGLPTTTVVASENEDVARRVQDALMTTRFRVYTNPDVVGVELGGALKNVIAFGVGISDGLGMGLNARAALITRGIAEIARLGVAMGARPLTFAGLAGLGDLVLTCTGDLSRNRRAGLAIGRGQKLREFLEETGLTVEGVPTTRAARDLSERLGVDMPITSEIYRVLFEDKSPEEGVMALMRRTKTGEIEEVATSKLV